MIQFQGFSFSNQSVDQKNQLPVGKEMKILHSQLNTNHVGTTPIQHFIETQNNFETKFCCIPLFKVLIQGFSNLIHSWEIKTFNAFQFERQKPKTKISAIINW